MSTSDSLKQAMLLQQAGDHAGADAIYRDVLRREPHNTDALHYLGALAYLRKSHHDALMLVDQALALAPGYSGALNTRGNILLALNKPHEALESYERALAAKPQSVPALNNLGNVLLELQQPAKALAFLDRALALAPHHRDALYNRANAYMKLERREEAVAAFSQCIAQYPDHLQAFYNRGIALQELGRIDEAAESYRQALSLDPGHAESHHNLALCDLVSGELSRGFANYEWRWRVAPQIQSLWNASPRRWLGREDLSGKTLLIHSEQGFGDTIQFSRFIPEVAKGAGRVVFQVQAPVKPLLSGLGPVAHVVAEGEPLPTYDFECPLLSLPHALGISLDTIPAPTPGLNANPDLVRKWRALLPASAPIRVGLAWSGRPDHPNDRHRSIAVQTLAPLQVPGVTFVSLQKEYRAGEREWLTDNTQIIDVSDHLNDFADTAALASLMDVVVSVDTSVAHLAGTLGRPVWVLLPCIAVDWRWLLGREDSPWYPTARLFRQPAMNDWNSVIARIKASLGKLGS